MGLPFTSDQFAIIPIIWAFIGGSAAVLLAVATDYALLAAGVLLTVLLFRQRPSNHREGVFPTGRALR